MGFFMLCGQGNTNSEPLFQIFSAIRGSLYMEVAFDVSFCLCRINYTTMSNTGFHASSGAL